MHVFRRLLTAFVLIGALTATVMPSLAGDLPAILSAPDTHVMQKEGRILLIDIRSPREWKQTGIAEGAVTITVHRRDFAKALLEIIDGDRSRTIAIICATGSRTAITRRYLERMGFTAVADVSEGMLGNDRGPGWIRRGLPVVAYAGK